jgi:predicted nucleic acid-binding protein
MYVFDRGASEVRALAANQLQIACSELGKIEVASVFHRKLREGALNAAEHQTLCAQFEQDIRTTFWSWLPITSAVLDQVRVAFQQLPPASFLRANDALHLTSARSAGFQEIYSNAATSWPLPRTSV